MKLTTLDLHTFVAIVDAKGISAAARALGVPKSSVSRELAALEERLGTRLIERTTRRLSLTHAGEVLISYARRVAEELDNAEAAVESLREQPRGHLAITAPYAMLKHILIPELPRFQARYPELTMSIDPTLRVLDLIDERIDVALRFGPGTSPEWTGQKLADLPLILVASSAYTRKRGMPASPLDLARHDLIDMGARAEPNEWRLVQGGGQSTAIPVAPRVAVADPSIVLDLAEAGLGIATAPRILAAKSLQARRLVHVLPSFTRGVRSLHAVYPSRRLLTPKVQAFVAFVAECLENRTGPT